MPVVNTPLTAARLMVFFLVHWWHYVGAVQPHSEWYIYICHLLWHYSSILVIIVAKITVICHCTTYCSTVISFTAIVHAEINLFMTLLT